MHDSKQNPKSLDLTSLIAQLRFSELKENNSYLSLLVFVIATFYFIYDIYRDTVVEGVGINHVLLEAGVFLIVLLALSSEVKKVINLSSAISFKQQEIKRLKKHMSEIIIEEFESWHLTKTENEIALLLIKGFSMQEIADMRSVKEKSIRQQATRIYTKAGVSNRNELTAYFIEDLLTPEI